MTIAKKFIKELKQYNTAPETILSLLDEKKHCDVIKPNECIIGGGLSLALFYLDDLDIYNNFSIYLIKRLLLKYQQEISFDGLILAIQLFIIQTFGPSTNRRVLSRYYCQREYEHVSIKDIYKKNWAVCIERTTFAHNLLKMLGLDDTIIVCDLIFDKRVEGHVLNVIRYNDEYYIIDFTNYSSKYNEIVVDDKKLKELNNVIPTVIKSTKKEYEDFINGQECIEFDIVSENLNEKTKDISHCTFESMDKHDGKKRNVV